MPSSLAREDVAVIANRLDDYTIAYCDNEENFRLLRDEWNALLDRAVHKSVFLKHQWMYLWWIMHGSRRFGARLYILTVRDRERRLVGVLPLYRESWGLGPFGLRVLRFLGSDEEAAEYLDAIVDRTQPQRVVETLLAGLESLRAEYEALYLTDMSEEALSLSLLPEWSKKLGGRSWLLPWMVCPYIKIAGDYVDYVQSLSANHRYNLRRLTRRLSEQYTILVDVAIEPQAVQESIEILFVLHRKRWSEKQGESKFDNRLSWEFHRRLAEVLAQDGAVRLYTLRCNDRYVAALYGFLYDNRLYYYQAGFDPEFNKNSVGLILMGKILDLCHQHQYQEFDFLRGQEAYKLNWAKQTRQTMACIVALSPAAKLYFHGQNFYRHLKARIRVLISRTSLWRWFLA